MSTYADFLAAKRQDGTASGFAPLWLPDFLFDFQRALVTWALAQGRAAIFADCGLGKGHPFGTSILTPTGWRNIETLAVGDRVIGSHGRSANVTGCFDRGLLPVYRVTFSDGASVLCDADHIWRVRTMNDQARGRAWRNLPTTELIALGLRYGAQLASRFRIPLVAPVEFDAQELPLDPYLLGALLGDGHLGGSAVLTAGDAAVVDEVAATVPAGLELRASGNLARAPSYRLTRGRGRWRNSVVDTLTALGLRGCRSWEKFVPETYLFARPIDRLALLQGLLDTDGEVRPDGLLQFSTASARLASDVAFLAQSLGGTARRSMKPAPRYPYRGEVRTGRPSHRVTLAFPNSIVPVRAKAPRYRPRPKYQPARFIRAIEPAGIAPVRCIAVDALDKLYVTEHCIVTHNTPMQLVWAENVVRETNRPVLIATPLAVSHQTVAEAAKFGIDCRRAGDGHQARLFPGARIIVTNYERLHLFDPAEFAGMVCDESSILKNFDGARRATVTEFLRTLRYRLLCTATAAPNDYIELGTSSEALGQLGHMDMLARFFKNDQNSLHPTSGRGRFERGMHTEGNKWRFKHHAREPFWRWVCSWARAVRRPSDLGFDDGPFVLPPLEETEHVVEARTRREGFLFDLPAHGLHEQREERRRTIQERCERVAALADDADQALVWCHLNREADLLAEMIPGAQQVSGSDADDVKEERLLAFARGELRALVTKPKLGAWGLNLQGCAHVVTFPSHSFESYYQSVRRCWRFGQRRPVRVDIVASEGERAVMANLRRKATSADQMFDALVAQMNDAAHLERARDFTDRPEVPAWL